MIDESTLNKLIPLPSETEALEEVKQTLNSEGFPINNYNKGGIMYGFLRIVVLFYIQLLKLARTIIAQCYIKHSSGDWKDIKAADYGKVRKEAQKTQGYVTITRENFTNAITITKGHGFKTLPDVNGYERKYYCIKSTVIPAGQQKGKVLVEAELAGSEYNVSPGMITISMIYIDGTATVVNDDDWLYREASNRETDDELTLRCLNSYSEMARRTTAAKLKSVAEEVPGVINVIINAQHPRGQGTTDIIVTGTAGEATEELLKAVEEHTLYLKGNYDDYLYKSAQVLRLDIRVIIYLAKDASQSGVTELGEEQIRNLLSVTRKELNIVYLDDIRYILKSSISDYRKMDFMEPVTDIIEESGIVILPGSISIEVRNVMN